jgi:cold shock CspA family protein
MKGRVKWWSSEGYGFIEINEQDSIFAHLKKDDQQTIIKENALIEFTIENDSTGTVLNILKLQEN